MLRGIVLGFEGLGVEFGLNTAGLRALKLEGVGL